MTQIPCPAWTCQKMQRCKPQEQEQEDQEEQEEQEEQPPTFTRSTMPLQIKTNNGQQSDGSHWAYPLSFILLLRSHLRKGLN